MKTWLVLIHLSSQYRDSDSYHHAIVRAKDKNTAYTVTKEKSSWKKFFNERTEIIPFEVLDDTDFVEINPFKG